MTCGIFLGLALESEGLYVLAFPLSDLVINFQRRLDLFLTEFCVTTFQDFIPLCLNKCG